MKPRISKSKLEAEIQKALDAVRIAEMATANANQALHSEDIGIFMASLCAHKSRLELEQAIAYLRRKS